MFLRAHVSNLLGEVVGEEVVVRTHGLDVMRLGPSSLHHFGAQDHVDLSHLKIRLPKFNANSSPSVGKPPLRVTHIDLNTQFFDLSAVSYLVELKACPP